MELLIATGGTGGHIYPALALAQEAEDRGIDVLMLLGQVKQGIEVSGFQTISVPSGPISGVGLRKKAVSAFALSAGVFKCLGLVRRGPLVAFGSYASVPALVAARLLRRPYWLMEQNLVPGATVKTFAPHARAVFTTFPGTQDHLPGARCIRTGNPLRKELKPVPKDRALQHWGFDPEKPMVLVVGGSLGARALSLAALEISRSFDAANFLVIAGRRDYPGFAERFGTRTQNRLLVEHVPDMSLAYSAADIAVARAGGGVSQELAFFGVPGILIPYPYAADNHQLANARALASTGGAVVLLEEEMDQLAEIIYRLLSDRKGLESMSRAIKTFNPGNARVAVLDAIMEDLKKIKSEV